MLLASVVKPIISENIHDLALEMNNEVEEITGWTFQTTHDVYEVLQNQSSNIERLSQKLDERMDSGLSRNIGLFKDETAEARKSLKIL